MTDKTLNKYINDAYMIDQQIKELKKTLDGYKSKITEAMTASGDTDKSTAKCKAHLTVSERKSVDTGKLKKENPERWEALFTEYPKITPYAALTLTAV